MKRIKTAQKCIFLRTKTNLLQLFSSIYNSQFLWGNILHKHNKYKVLCPNTFKLVAIPKVGQNITSKKNFFKIWKVSSRDYPEGRKVLEQCSSRLVGRMSAILYKLLWNPLKIFPLKSEIIFSINSERTENQINHTQDCEFKRDFQWCGKKVFFFRF